MHVAVYVYGYMRKQREVNGAISVWKRIDLCGKSITLEIRVCTCRIDLVRLRGH